MTPLVSVAAMLLLLLLLSVSLPSAVCGASVRVVWDNVTFVSKTRTTLQLVINPLILRESPVHDEVFSVLRRLNTTHARYASWFPYPKLSVPELEPPSGLSQCSDVGVGSAVHLSCARGGGVISAVEFASFGVASGVCLSYANTSCSAAGTQDIISKRCIGQQNCSVDASADIFGDPCPDRKQEYRLAVQIACNPPQNNTYWNFTYFDPPVEDFLQATRGGLPMLELCTSPSWLYNQSGLSPHHYPDSYFGRDWDYNQGTRLLDPSCNAIGEFYGRLAAWYTSGGFRDEYGHEFRSPHHYRLGMWEVLNEMERNTDITEYICIYDAVVRHIRAMADPQHEIQFVALAEGNAEQFDDYAVFLNASNHAPGTPLDWISYHRYAGASSRTDPIAYEDFFPNFDEFFTAVARIERTRLSLSPSTRTSIDEIGVILPNDNDDDAAPFPLVYWNAVSAAFAYMFAHLSGAGIDVLGSSQLVGYPLMQDVPPFGVLEPQYPSVSMVNWTTGAGTARVWLLDLLIREFQPGDLLVHTDCDALSDVMAQAYVRRPDGGQDERRLLLINKRSTAQTVTVEGAQGGMLLTVDEASGEKPARREKLDSDSISMQPFAVSVVRMPAQSADWRQEAQ